MPTKNTDYKFQIKSAKEDGSFAGYASVFGIVDSQRDVIMKGAFARTIKKRAGEVKLLWQHQVDEPIGVFTRVREDGHGLYVEGRLLLELQRGQEAYALLKNKAINGLSIGYSVRDADYNPDIEVRLITDVDLWEISLVTFPANEKAVVTQVKNSGQRSVIRGQEREVIISIDRAIAALGV